MSKKLWHDDIPAGGVLVNWLDSIIRIMSYDSEYGCVFDDSGDCYVMSDIDYMRPLTAEEWWEFMPWQDMKDAPRDGSEFMALTKGKVCTVFFEAEDDSFITDFNDNGDFYRVFDFKWLPLPQVSA